MSIHLPDCLNCPDGATFAARLKTAITQLPPGSLPLQQATTQGGLVDDSQIAVTVLGSQRGDNEIVARVGVFFEEVVGGCNCHDDPVSVNGYCTLQVRIDANTGEAKFLLINH